MPQVMALKWRPQVFADMVGQEAVTRTLQNAIKSGRIAHAYIFAGPRGVGKTTTARIFAKVLNCKNPKDAEPCNDCDICTEVNQGSAMDVIEIDAASFNRVEDIRNLQEQVGTYPAKAKYKVYIFDEAHRITRAAFDAFLKTLEEPPAHVIFILASTEIHQFPPTVQSRCQRFEFRAMGLDSLTRQLRRIADAEGIEVDDRSLHQIARSAGGSMRDGQRTLDQLVAFSGKKITAEDIRIVLGTIEGEVFLKLAQATLDQDTALGLTTLQGVLEGGRDLEHFYTGLLETFRHLAVGRAYPEAADKLIPLSTSETQDIVRIASQMDEAQIFSSLRILIEQEWAVRHSANPSIVVETVVLELCRMKQLVSVDGLLAQAEKGLAPKMPVASFKPVPTPRPTTTVVQPIPVSVPRLEPGEPVLAVEEIEDPVDAGKNPDLAKLKAQWREFVEKVTAQSKSLGGVLADVKPLDLEGDTLKLSCKSVFHQEQVSKSENKALLEKTVEDLLGRKVSLLALVPQSANATVPKASAVRAPKPLSAPKVDLQELEKEEPMVAAVVKMFGGKIVEVKRDQPKK